MLVESFLDSLGAEAVLEVTGQAGPAVLRPTTDAAHGDYQLNAAMPLAKRLGQKPRELALRLAAVVEKSPAVKSALVAGPGFVNLKLDDGWLGERLSEDARDLGREGVPKVDRSTRILVDFSSPNIAKQMHVGHLRSTIIGDALVRLLRFVGHEVLGDNHLGDWGTQFGLLMVGMRRFGDFDALREHPVNELERVYKLAHAAAETEPAVADEARAELAKLQSGDPENRRLWESFVQATRTELDRNYARLGVTFDHWLGESAYHDQLPMVVGALQERGLVREDDGALCVFWNELEGVPADLKKQKEPFIVKKKDGAYLYSTTDIATVLYRRDHFGTERTIYVVDSRQALHFRQLFALMERLGVRMRLEHVSFGTVLDDQGKPLKTREGKAITLASLLDEAESRAEARIREGIAEKFLDLEEGSIAAVARAVGIGAVKYADLHQNRTSDYQFDWDKMLSFRGNAGPTIQYAHARIKSVFAKAGLELDQAMGPVLLSHATEAALGRVLIRFGQVVHQAAETCYPHLLTDHLYDLARAFGAFYEACPILKAEGSTRSSRLGLAGLTARQLRRGLDLLGIEAVDRM